MTTPASTGPSRPALPPFVEPTRAPGARRRAAGLRALGLVTLVGVAAFSSAWRGGWRPTVPPSPTVSAGRPDALARGDLVVLDGDTLLVRGRVTRLLGADAPERAARWFDGSQEPWASRASALVRSALDGATTITIVRGAEAQDDRGRDLAHILVDGRTLSALLVEAGLGVETLSRFGDGGLPDLADQIRAAAARRARPVEFEEPWRWRREHRTEPAARAP